MSSVLFSDSVEDIKEYCKKSDINDSYLCCEETPLTFAVIKNRADIVDCFF